MKKILIMAYESPGLYNDALIYESVLEKNFEIKIVMAKNIFEAVITLKENISDIYIFLENIFDINLYDKDYKKKLIIFMPNQELFADGIKLSIINVILCKSLLAKDMFESIKKTEKFSYTCFYTKFTTYIPQDLRNLPIIKDENLFICWAGKSPFKNVDILVNVWIKNNGFLNIDPKIKLIITCYRSCQKQLIKNLLKYHNIKFVKTSGDIFKYKNLTLHNVKLENEEYTKYLTSANCALCISKKEGYGHYINESRYFSTCILTTNAPPMNELVINNKNGFLVDVNKNKDSNQFNYQLYNVYPKYLDLKEKIIQLIKNKSKLKEYGKKGRELYDQDKEYFIRIMETQVIPFMSNWFNN
jgi:glycosyltransferase involved in cell wall biosynthesis